MPTRIAPMLAQPAAAVPRPQHEWSFEVKWDGVRAIAYARGGRLRLQSRNLREISDGYPEIQGLPRALAGHEAVLDGEIVALDGDGRPSFELLQRRMHVTSPAKVRRLARTTPVVYVIFDLLHLDGETLLELPYGERRARLEALDLRGRAWWVPAAHVGARERLLEATRAQGLEGVIAKRLRSRYEPGRRSGAWLKLRHTLRQELVVGGWLPGAGDRAERVGALLVGSRRDGRLVYAGRVGSGLRDATREELGRRLAPLRCASSPFDGAPKLPPGAVFVRPRLLAQVEFRGWTAEGVMRAPSLKGLREAEGGRVVARARGRSAGVRAHAPFDAARVLAEGALAVVVDGRGLRLTNWDKVLFPRSGFTKGELITYYAQVAPWLLPHLRDRALTLKRYPDGVQEGHFYEKRPPAQRPDWVATCRIGGSDFTLAQDRATLVWLANLASIELHSSLSRAAAPEIATAVVFDLDPGEPAGLRECCEVALVLRELFERLELQSFAKTSGAKGIQVYVPLNGDASFRQTKPLARRIAQMLERRLSELVVARMARTLRPGRVAVDWGQNDARKTTVAVYSVRARERPTVSTPVSWEEVGECRAGADPAALRFAPDDVLARVRSHGDLFAPVESLTQRLPRWARLG